MWHWDANMLSTAMLLGLFVRWEVLGTPQYSSMEPGQSIAYVLPIGPSGIFSENVTVEPD